MHPTKHNQMKRVRQTCGQYGRKRLKTELDELKRLYFTVIDDSPLGIAFLKPDGEWHELNRTFRHFLRTPSNEWPSERLENLIAQEDRMSLLTYLNKMLQGSIQKFCFQTCLTQGHGQGLAVVLAISLLRKTSGTPDRFLVQAQDIDGQRRQAREYETQVQEIQGSSVELMWQKERLEETNLKLRNLASHDGLTRLHNHESFQRHLLEEYGRAERNGAPLSLLMLDVDRFKHYNDSFGHPEGDKALIQLAEILQREMRISDMAARYGGEEFVVLLPETDEAGAMQAGERIRSAVEQGSWALRKVTVSIGAATCVQGMPAPSELVHQADEALYRSKAEGRNRVTHHQSLADLSRKAA